MCSAIGSRIDGWTSIVNCVCMGRKTVTNGKMQGQFVSTKVKTHDDDDSAMFVTGKGREAESRALITRQCQVLYTRGWQVQSIYIEMTIAAHIVVEQQ